MLIIVTEEVSPELNFVTGFIFGSVLKIPFRIQKSENTNYNNLTGDIYLFYTKDPPEGGLNIYYSGYTGMKPTEERPPEILWSDGEPLFHFGSGKGKGFFGFDFFAMAGYFLSGSAYLKGKKKDELGRYDPSCLPARKEGLYRYPWIDIFARRLGEKIQRMSGEKKISGEVNARLKFTVDIDVPWYYKHKPLPVNIGGAIKDLLKFRGKRFLQRLKTLTGIIPDPFDVYDLLKEILPPGSVFFFLMRYEKEVDVKYGWNKKAMRKLVQTIRQDGNFVGLHPSFYSMDDGDRIKDEKSRLEDLLGEGVTRSRQHFLRFRIPRTFELLEKEGITEDYSLCFPDEPGFSHLTAHPFPFFNIGSGQESELVLHPAVFMDRHYLNDPAAIKELMSMAVRVKRTGGELIIIFHNNTFSNFLEWEGKSREMINLTQKLKLLFEDEG